MSITDELRECIATAIWQYENGIKTAYIPKDRLTAIADRIDAEHAYQMAECRLVREHFGRCGNRYRLVCSECHHVVYDGWQEKPRFCPYCGRMVVA